MEHFRVLPTDERFIKLTNDQMDILLVNFLIRPDDSFIKESYQKDILLQNELKNFPDEQFKKMGYSEKQILKIKEDYMSRGV